MARIRTVLFDLDGVLVDAGRWHFEALNLALRPYGFEITREEHETILDGLPTRRKLELLTRDKGLPTSLHRSVYDLKQAYTRRRILEDCRPAPEKVLLLRRLREDGFRLGVCSNAVRETVDLMLDRSGMAGLLECVLTPADVGRPKPAPDIYREAMRRLESAPLETVIVEDGRYGIESARGAGGRVLEVHSCEDVDYPRVSRFIKEVERVAAVP